MTDRPLNALERTLLHFLPSEQEEATGRRASRPVADLHAAMSAAAVPGLPGSSRALARVVEHLGRLGYVERLRHADIDRRTRRPRTGWRLTAEGMEAASLLAPAWGDTRADRRPYLTPREAVSLAAVAQTGRKYATCPDPGDGVTPPFVERMTLRGFLEANERGVRVRAEGRRALQTLDPRPLLLINLNVILSDGKTDGRLVRVGRGPGVDHFLIPLGMPARMEALERLFACVWCTAERHDAYGLIARALGIARWPVLELGEPAADGGHLPAVARYAAETPFAWVDPEIDEYAHDWADARDDAGIPTLLCRSTPGVGLRRSDMTMLEVFAQSVRAEAHIPRATGGRT